MESVTCVSSASSTFMHVLEEAKKKRKKHTHTHTLFAFANNKQRISAYSETSLKRVWFLK